MLPPMKPFIAVAGAALLGVVVIVAVLVLLRQGQIDARKDACAESYDRTSVQYALCLERAER